LKDAPGCQTRFVAKTLPSYDAPLDTGGQIGNTMVEMPKKIRIDSTTHPRFAEFWSIYEHSFPLCERRDLSRQETIFQNPTYRLEAWLEEDQLIGFIGWWSHPHFTYVEHYAINPNLKSKGHGTRLLKEWMAGTPTPIVLEIEPVTDETTRRRLNFYRKLSFVETSFPHRHPAYHRGLPPVDLDLLSHPKKIPEAIHRELLGKQKIEIMPPCL
jgi:ribosomal protein S18 acetylase RimI-like enzyme